ncbi:glycosyl transferase [Mesorhizobium sp. L-8-10]|uniref:glycosyltransferase family 4 protein n=1 Tax=Mesorhizobium sp. L-8-10 TaxID=2744523 RepID=UPI001927579E|nr:glycosyltransferase family 4 protein [Mesorhizobium sp. L-8-10]BCH29269.1 glycosyl transferase [Mesorhizobium sp. L-8-10]
MRGRIAFYAPLKTPDHPIPSGDREVARLMMAALETAGYEVELASRLISYQKRPSAEIGRERRLEAQGEAGRLIDAWLRGAEQRPDLWFTYHPYCKAPDWIGPRVAEALGIGYVTAEACRTRQGTDEDWAASRRAVQAAVKGAAVNFCLKPSDRAYLESFLPDMETVVSLLPFVDLARIDSVPEPAPDAERFSHGHPLILAVGMMRPNAKFRSYELLAAALGRLPDLAWKLAIVGDGPMRGNVERLLSALPAERVHFAGAIGRDEVLRWMRAADIMAWPGFSEAFGMVYLEAQACGLPVVALHTAGVPVVVEDAVSGMLTAEDAEAYAAALRSLLASEAKRRAYGAAGRRNVERSHNIASAAKVMRDRLGALVNPGDGSPVPRARSS